MRHWNRSVSIDNEDVGEHLKAEISRRWPETQYPFHIEVVNEQTQPRIQVRVWTYYGLLIARWANPAGSRERSPTVVAVLDAIELAVTEAIRERAAPKRTLE